MANSATTGLGSGLSVDHFANSSAQISVGMIGGKYRVVRSWVVNGRLHEVPVDGLTFSSIQDARQHQISINGAQVQS